MPSKQSAVPTLTVNGKKYAINSLSQQARAELASMRFAEDEVRRLRAQMAVAQTAANAYRNSLIAKLPAE